MSKAFHVPADLADTNLSLSEVHRIVEGRRKMKVLQNRIDRTPDKIKKLTHEISLWKAAEAGILNGATLRGKPAE